jgi:hypothetical protein
MPEKMWIDASRKGSYTYASHGFEFQNSPKDHEFLEVF